jgi:hypothetical protein
MQFNLFNVLSYGFCCIFSRSQDRLLITMKRLADITEFILRYPEEVTMTVEDEIRYKESANESDSRLVLTASGRSQEVPIFDS